MADQPMQNVFVIGPSGCGTTMIGRILASGADAAAIAGNHAGGTTTPEPLRDCSAWLDEITTRLWDERASFAARARAEADLAGAIRTLHALAAEVGVSTLIWKRSTPFLDGNTHAPDLADLGLFAENPRLVLVTRDPRASAGSTLRRDHHEGLRQAAVVCNRRWPLMCSQAAALPPGTAMHLRYESFCKDPLSFTDALAAHTGISKGVLHASITAERVTADRLDAWRGRLTEDDIADLDRYFDADRRAAMDAMIETIPGLRTVRSRLSVTTGATA